MIDILIPVLERPDNAQPVVDSIRRHTQVEHRILFLVSRDDSDEQEACERSGADVEVVPFAAGSSDYARKVNHGYRVTGGEFMLMGADDLEFLADWDNRALIAAATGAGVIGTNDLANPHVISGLFSTHPLIRRSYIDERGGSLDGPGIVLHEGYDHNYVDRELCALAQHRGQWAFAEQAHIRHFRPGNRADSVYEKSRRRFKEDGRLFMSRSHRWNYAGLTPKERRRLARAAHA